MEVISPLFPVVLHDLPRRICSVPGHGEYEVCQHIIRIDINRGGKRSTRGWQVRYRGHTKMFSDFAHPPEQSLQQAIAHLAERYEGPTVMQQKADHVDKHVKLGKPGLRIVLAPKAGRRGMQVYVEVSHPLRGHSPRRLYAGMEGKVSEEKLDALIEQGVQLRRRWREEVLAERQAAYKARCAELMAQKAARPNA